MQLLFRRFDFEQAAEEAARADARAEEEAVARGALRQEAVEEAEAEVGEDLREAEEGGGTVGGGRGVQKEEQRVQRAKDEI
jgi:hypothetical protein